eukprot:6421438-Alexandrium_andersonii.AAC.1
MAGFRSEYTARAQKVHSSKSKKGGAKASKLVLPHHMEQRDAKKFLPPGASIWRSAARGEWNGHLPPNRRVSEPYLKHGSSEQALK